MNFNLLSFKRCPYDNDSWPISLGDLNIILGAWNDFSGKCRESCDRLFFLKLRFLKIRLLVSWLKCLLSEKNSFRRNLANYGTPCQAIDHFIFWCHHVTYSTLCYASGHLVIYCKCYGFEREFFISGVSLHTLLLLIRLPWDRQFNLKVSRASCWSSKHSTGPTICLNHSNPQKEVYW